MPCSLCNCTTRDFEIIQEREYVQCTACKAILLSPQHFLSPQAEKFRYSLHNNDITDPSYIAFASPIINRIKEDFNSESIGLDFGCGTGPVIASELEKSGFKINLYDPYFKPNKAPLKIKYDFIICCEVMEHFKQPLKEFQLLRSLLKKGGKLYCKTEIWNSAINFKDWHYKNDLTHVIFYNKETLDWIKDNLNFSQIDVRPKFLVFTA
jgi:SAM-dependent methyltransferase